MRFALQREISFARGHSLCTARSSEKQGARGRSRFPNSHSYENKILALLSASSGDILEDEELIETLSTSKITSTRIGEQVKMQEMTAAQITKIFYNVWRVFVV